MSISELKKILRNNVFRVMFVAIALANILTILYCSEKKEEVYVQYLNESQQQYVESYEVFIGELDERGELLLQARGENNSEFYKRNIQKTRKDYSGLKEINLDNQYNEGMEEYAKYSFGIFFSILFAFVTLEFLYFFEKRNGMIQILRSTKNGRRRMIRSKWIVYTGLVVVFAFVQEIITVLCYHAIYSLGNLECPVQSLSVFRDCSLNLTMWDALLLMIGNRVFLALTASAVIFFFGIIITDIVTAVGIAGMVFTIQYVFYKGGSINSSLDKLCCINLFYAWDMNKFIGEYHNINLFGYPIGKNVSMAGVCLAFLIFAGILGPAVFSVRYQNGNKRFQNKIGRLIRRLFSKFLQFRNLFVNECYKLFFLQKKWIIVAFFLFVGIKANKIYLPVNYYQTAYESAYHMYIANTEGEICQDTRDFIKSEQAYILMLEEMMKDAIEEGDEAKYLLLSVEYKSKNEAFKRFMEQYEKIAEAGEKTYVVDELDYNKLISRYQKDVMLFMISALCFIIYISGIFASAQENKIYQLTHSTRNGREKIYVNKIMVGIFLLVFTFAVIQIPTVNGYVKILKPECFHQRLSYLYEPYINSSMTILGLLILVLLIRFLLYLTIGVLTVIMAGKTKNEFMTTVFLSTIVIIGCLVFYFLKMNLTLMLIQIIGG